MKTLFLLLALLLTPLSGMTGDNHIAAALTGVWARATPPGVTTSAIYMSIANHKSTKIKLISAKSAVTDRIELHNTTMKDGMMQMRQIDGIEIAKMATVELKPHGMHMMLFNLQEPLEEGTKILVELLFNDGQTMSVEVPVMKQLESQDHSEMKTDKHKDH